MNDAYRGALIVGALTALYMAAMLAFAFLRQLKRPARRYIAHHALLMTLALAITAGLIVTRMVDVAGENRPLEWWDAARGAQVMAMAAGLRPLWAHQRQASARRESTA